MDIETISNEIVVAIKQLTAPFEKWDNEDKQFAPEDSMNYVRKVLLEKLLDGTYYLHIGKTGDSSESYAASMKRKAEVAYRHRDGTEISNNLIRGAAGEAQAATQKHEYLETLYMLISKPCIYKRQVNTSNLSTRQLDTTSVLRM